MRTPTVNLAAVDARIYSLRGVFALLDQDLADLYGVTPSALMQAVRRNRQRFPADFIFSAYRSRG